MIKYVDTGTKSKEIGQITPGKSACLELFLYVVNLRHCSPPQMLNALFKYVPQIIAIRKVAD